MKPDVRNLKDFKAWKGEKPMPPEAPPPTGPPTPLRAQLAQELVRSLEIMTSEIETAKYERAITSLLHIKALLEKFIALESGLEKT